MRKFKEFLYCIRNDVFRNNIIGIYKDSIINGVILMFHNITDSYVDIDASCKCSIKDFKCILKLYKSLGYQFVSMDDAISIITQKKQIKFAVVTFDDIPDNVYQNAYPILKENFVPFTVFITLNFINKNTFISMEQLLELNKDPLCTIGAHTLTHPFLRYSENSSIEILQSKVELEAIIGKPVKYFAYPYGRYSSVSKNNIEQVKFAGFECAFSSISAPITDISLNHLYFLPRVVPTTSDNGSYKKEWSVITLIKLKLNNIKCKWFNR